MRDDEKIYFLQQLDLIFQLYGKKLNVELGNLYWEELLEYSWADVRAAMRAHTQTGKYLPRVADLVEKLHQSGAAGKAKVSSNRCTIQHPQFGDQCPFTASRGSLCSYHGHFSDYPDQGIMGVVVDLAYLYPQQLLKPFREKDTHLFIKTCKQIEKDFEMDKQKNIEVRCAQVTQRVEPKANTDGRMQAVKDILVKQNSPWAMENRNV